MKNTRKSSIGRRIAALVAVSVLMSIVVIASLLVWYQVNASIKNKKSALEATGYVYAAAIADNVVDGNKQRASSVLRSIARVPDILYATALDDRGGVIAAMGNTTFLQDDMITSDQDPVSMMTKGILPVAVDIVRSGKTVGRLVLIADIKPMRSELFWTILATMAAAVIASLAGVAIAVPLQHRITAPILSLTRAMRHIAEARDYTMTVKRAADDETGVLVDAFNTMIAEIGQRDSSLETLAYFDPLTGLPNRQDFHRQIDSILAKAGGPTNSAALFLLDLDDFQQINDVFGHSAGDEMLIGVAAILKQTITGDFKLARLGGDEFAIIAENVTSEAQAQEKIAAFVAALYRPVRILEHDIHISASIGVAMIPRDGTSSADLMRRADIAMYSAKNRGLGLVHFFHPAMDAVIQEHAELAQGLRQAISNEEFRCHYQPQVNLANGQVYGFECLIRWQHPERGEISPGKFIPVAEHSGLISRIGNWILRDSCARGRGWLDAGLAPSEISVNVSAAQIHQPAFLSDVQAVLRDTGFPPSLLCLELTESLFIGKTIEKVRKKLDELKTLGIALALDDFGTGYSSLSYLVKLPFDKIKIDRSFVAGIESDRTKRDVLKGIIDLVHTFGMEVIAEGAESYAEIAVLRQLGADRVQGFAIARAMPAEMAISAATAIAAEFQRNLGGKIAIAGN